MTITLSEITNQIDQLLSEFDGLTASDFSTQYVAAEIKKKTLALKTKLKARVEDGIKVLEVKTETLATKAELSPLPSPLNLARVAYGYQMLARQWQDMDTFAIRLQLKSIIAKGDRDLARAAVDLLTAKQRNAIQKHAANSETDLIAELTQLARSDDQRKAFNELTAVTAHYFDLQKHAAYQLNTRLAVRFDAKSKIVVTAQRKSTFAY